jgi:hypothetical protein
MENPRCSKFEGDTPCTNAMSVLRPILWLAARTIASCTGWEQGHIPSGK